MELLVKTVDGIPSKVGFLHCEDPNPPTSQKLINMLPLFSSLWCSPTINVEGSNHYVGSHGFMIQPCIRPRSTYSNLTSILSPLTHPPDTNVGPCAPTPLPGLYHRAFCSLRQPRGLIYYPCVKRTLCIISTRESPPSISLAEQGGCLTHHVLSRVGATGASIIVKSSGSRQTNLATGPSES